MQLMRNRLRDVESWQEIVQHYRGKVALASRLRENPGE